MEDKSTTNFIDAESQFSSSKDDLSINFILLEHIRRLGNLMSKEFRSSYIDETIINGIVYRKNIEDNRLSLFNAIEFLRLLLLPHYDSTMKTKDDEIQNKLIELLETYKDKKTLEDYEDFVNDKLNLQKIMLQELSGLLFRKNYMKETQEISRL